MTAVVPRFPLKLAIIGGGPSGFYLAARVLHLTASLEEPSQTKGSSGSVQAISPIRIHIYERLKFPHGLVRYGVAPDHPEVKNCIHKFDRVIQDHRVRYFGNVHVGGTGRSDLEPMRMDLNGKRSVSLSDLFPYYTHLAFATGAPIPKLHPRLPLSRYCIPALDIVHWYTGHPESPRKSPLPSSTRHVTIIGHGNVSLDIARMILSSADRLDQLDMPVSVKSDMAQFHVKHVDIIGRRGPKDVRFTPKEIREIMALENAVMDPIPPKLFERIDASSLSRQQTRIVQLLQNGSKSAVLNQSRERKTFSMRFFEQPGSYREIEPGLIELELEETCLTSSGDVVSAYPLRRRVVHTNLIVTSLGYESSPALFQDPNEAGAYPWFDERSKHIRTLPAGGRVLAADGRIVRNVYASGWAGQGAQGVIAGTIIDANDVAAAIIQDWSGDQAENEEEKKQWKIGPIERIPSPLAIQPTDGLDTSCNVIEQGVRDGSVYAYNQAYAQASRS